MTLPVVLAIAGCVALLIGVFGGQIEVQTLRVNRPSLLQRIFAVLFGLIFIGIAIWLGYSPAPTSPAPQPISVTAPATQTIAISSPVVSLSPTPTSTTSPVVPIAPSVVPITTKSSFGLAGNWQGTDTNLGIIRFTFNEYCSIGEICGTLAFLAKNCKEFPVLVSINTKTFIFKETNQQGCLPPDGNDTIIIRQDGALLYGPNGQSPSIPLLRQP
jgi:hypothetical protein